ncbi:AsmA-like C-terminal region-containing protein [uncultured Pseudoteredinibacter sp.]|uniref:YhdP family phospholipid transporter n=1 Tax=uncultured Pseudoteredinibacter sp. TaxID=1641701 RepID=UPI00260A82C9|nr:AsmA-like C-terminal region-containing protein [uncultured Pseudoteredinibacter sp.]
MKTSWTRSFARRFWGLCAAIVISLALLVQAGRFLLPMINDHRDDIADVLGEQLGVQVSIANIEGRWLGMRPEITVEGLTLRNKGNEQVLAVDSVYTQFDLLRSLFNWRLAWSDFRVDDVTVALQQFSDGQIYLRGVVPSERDDPEAETLSPLELLLLRGRVELSAVKIEFHPLQGESSTWQLPEVVMENTQSFHRLKAQLNSAGRPLMKFVFEGEGDPRDRETFLASSYLELNHVKISELAEQFSSEAWEQFPQREQLQDVALTGKLWTVKLPGSFMELRGSLQSDGGRSPLPEVAKMDISGLLNSTGQWQLSLQNLHGKFSDFELPEPLNVGLEFGDSTPLALRSSRIDIGYWYRLAVKHNWIPEGELQDVLASLRPAGHLNNVYLRLGNNIAKDFLLQANLEQMSAGAWQGAPAVSGVDGYVETSAKRGFVDIDSQNGFSMHYTTVYDDAQRFETMKGQVQWVLDRDANSIYVNSGQLSMQQGETQVRGAMQLFTPWFADTVPSDLTLFIGLRNDKVSNYPKYLPNVVADSLKKFLADAKGEGELRNGAFIYRGGLKASLDKTYTTQLALDLEDVSLNYMEGWPRLSKVNTRLEVDGRFLHATAAGQSMGLALSDIQVDLEDNPKANGDRINVKARFKGQAQQGFDFLLNSPIASSQAEDFQFWELHGPLSGDVDLQIPLSLSENRGAKYDINANFRNAELYIPELALHFEKLNAKLKYDLKRGLHGNNLQASLWGQSIEAKLGSTAKSTDLRFDSQLAIEPLAQWMNIPGLLMAEGKTAVKGKLSLPSTFLRRAEQQGPNQLELATSLQGIAINLPEPYGKAAEQARKTNITIPIQGKEELATNEVQEQLHLQYALAEGVADDEENSTSANTDSLALSIRQHRDGESLALGLNGVLPDTRAGQGLISGELQTLDIEPWLSIVDDYRAAQTRYAELRVPSQAGSQLPEQEAIPVDLEIKVKALNLAGFNIPNIELQAGQTQQGILLNAKSEMLAGSIEYFDSQRPLDVRIAHLNLPELADSEEPADSTPQGETPQLIADDSDNWDFSAFPHTQVQIEQLRYGARALGSWRFQIQAGEERGLLVDRIFGELGDIRVSGDIEQVEGADAMAAADPGASLNWSGGYISNSKLQGRIQFKNINTLSQQWQMPSILESESAEFRLAMNWPGSPMDFDSRLIAGKLNLGIQNGRFFQSAGAGGNAVLRLLSVLNFDTWVRRLRLDFADLYKEGMVFDSVNGHIDFQQQELLIQEPIIVKGPTSRLQFAGKIDWEEESLDTSLVATLPVGNNVALATGLLVNWPAAVGVYVASKLFSNQVDKVASVSYSMTGSWDDPKMEFERLFDSKAAKDAGEKVAEEVEHKETQVETQLSPQRSSQQEAVAETPKESQEQIPATEEPK